MNESTLMMSPELQGLIPDLEDEPLFNKPNFPIVVFSIVGKDDPLKGYLAGISNLDQQEVEINVGTKIALEIFKNASNISFESIQIIYSETLVPIGGPFIINGCKISNVNQPTQTCTLHLKLATIPVK